MERPSQGLQGLWHLALRVRELNRSRTFYETLFGMRVIWHPDPENVYLSSGRDNLALHQIPPSELRDYTPGIGQYLDHLGFIVDSSETVDRFFREAEQAEAAIVNAISRFMGNNIIASAMNAKSPRDQAALSS